MMKNEMKSNNKTVLLAILAVFAMIAAGAVVVMASGEDVDAESVTATQLTTTPTAAVTATNYIANTGTAEAPVALTLADVETPGTIYLLKGTTLQVTGSAGTDVFNIVLCSAISGSGTSWTVTCEEDQFLGLQDGTAAADATVTASADGKYVTITGTGAAISAFGVNVDEGEKYYPVGATVTGIVLTVDDDTVVIGNATATVSQTVAGYAGQVTVSPAAVPAAQTVTLTYHAEAVMSITVSDAAANNNIKLDSGAAAWTAALTNVTLDAYASVVKTTATGTLYGSAPATGNAITYVYGEVTGGTIKRNDAKLINFVEATGTYMIANGDKSYTIIGSGFTGTLKSDNGAVVWGAGALNLASGNYTYAADAVAGALTVGTSATLAVAGGLTLAASQDLIIRGTMSIAGDVGATNANISVYGTFGSAADRTVTLTSTAGTAETPKTVTFKAFAGSTLTKISVVKGAEDTATNKVVIDLSGATGTVYLKGTISADASYNQTQAVVVDGDLTITGYATILIEGSFDVLEGVEVTIAKGTIIVNSDVADVEILGEVFIEEDGFLNITKTKAVKIAADVDNFGMFYSNAPQASLTGGATLVNEDGAFFKTNALTIDAGTTLNLAGYTDVADVTNKGAVILDGAELARINLTAGELVLAPTSGTAEGDKIVSKVTMAAAGAAVDIKSFAFVNCFNATASTLTIDDSGISKGKLLDGYTNKVTLTAADDADKNVSMGLSGIYFESSTSSSRAGAGDAKYLDRTLSMSGVATIFDIKAEASDAPTATIALTPNGGKTADFRFAEGVALTKGITFDVDNTMAIAGLVVLTDATIDATTPGADLVITGMVSSNKNTGIAVSGNVSDVSFSITEGTTTTYYYSDLEGAVAAIDLARRISLEGGIKHS